MYSGWRKVRAESSSELCVFGTTALVHEKVKNSSLSAP